MSLPTPSPEICASEDRAPAPASGRLPASEARPRISANLPAPTVTLGSLAKVGAFALVVYLAVRLWPLLSLSFLALLLAVALEPVVERLSRRMPRGAAVLCVALSVGAAFVAAAALVAPTLAEQLASAAKRAPDVVQKTLEKWPQSSPAVRIGKRLLNGSEASFGPMLGQIVAFGQLAVGGLTSVALVYALAMYLLVDGKSAWRWILAFFRAGARAKLEETAEAVSPIVSAYVLGQAITSGLCGLVVFAALQLLGVPGAAMLAVIAGALDVLPVLGFALSLAPAAICGLAVSPGTALAVVAIYSAYHLAENYFILPLVYGNRLRLSGLVVLASLLAAWALAGVVGAIAILPVVASYPCIERIWLSGWVGRDTIRRHEAEEATVKSR